MRIVYVTDLHGSTMAFEKAINAAIYYDANFLLFGGDLSGKKLLPLIKISNGEYKISEPFVEKGEDGNVVEVPIERFVSEKDLTLFLKRIEAKGWYWLETNIERLQYLNQNINELRQLFDDKIVERLLDWSKIISEQLPEEINCYWTGGNDDSESFLNNLLGHDLGKFQYSENKIVELQGYEMMSLGYSNKTPFKTERELEEEELFNKLMLLFSRVKNKERLILNVHVPPYNCGKLDLVIDPKNHTRYKNVGSTAVRKFIEEIHPIVDFTGHIHEGKGRAQIGRTQVFNPGSEFYQGLLYGYVVDISGSIIKDYVHFIR